MKYLLIPAGAALIAILPLPIDAYHLIRWIVAGFCAFGAYEIFQSKTATNAHGMILAVIVVVFNPLQPMYFSREVWIVVDVIAAGLLIFLSNKPSTINKYDGKVEEFRTIAIEKAKRLEKSGNGFARQMLKVTIFTLIFIGIFAFAIR